MRRLLALPLILALTTTTTRTQIVPTHDAVFSLSEGSLSGTVTFVVDARGRVSGTIIVPADGVDGRLGGSVKDGVWTIDIVYTMAGRDCEGRVTGTADVPADRQKIAGKIQIGGSCTQPEKPATFVFTRRPRGYSLSSSTGIARPARHDRAHTATSVVAATMPRSDARMPDSRRLWPTAWVTSPDRGPPASP